MTWRACEPKVMTMTSEIPRLDKNAAGEAVTAALEEAGCVIVENLYSEAEMDQLSADLNPWFEERPTGIDDFSGYKTRRVSSLVARSEIARNIALNETVLDVCDRLLLPNCNVYRLQVTHMVDLGPGEIRQIIHRDDGIYPEIFHNALPELNCLVHGMWAVTDFTLDNGATSLVPGSHRWEDRERMPEEHEVNQAVMPKGSVALYLGATYHGGGENRSNTHRVGALFGYALGWLRQEENMYLACPPEVARTFSEKLQRLVGYDQFSKGAGWVDNANPQIVLQEDATFEDMRSY